MTKDTTLVTNIKSYIEILYDDELKRLFYSISEVNDGIAEFTFKLPEIDESSQRDTNALYSWHVYHNFVYEVEDVVSTDWGVQLRRSEPLDQRESAYDIQGIHGGKLTIKCHVKSRNLGGIIDSYQTEYSNKLAHVELLIKNERKLNSELQSRDETIAKQTKEIEERNNHIAELDSEIADYRTTIDQTREELANSKQVIEDTAKQLEASQSEVAAKEAELANSKQVIEDTAKQLEASQSEVAAKEAELANSKQVIEDTAKQLEASLGVIDDYNAKYSSYVKPELDRLHVIESSKTWRWSYGFTHAMRKLFHPKKVREEEEQERRESQNQSFSSQSNSSAQGSADATVASSRSALSKANEFVHHINKTTVTRAFKYAAEDGPIKGTEKLFNEYKIGQEARHRHEDVEVSLPNVPNGRELRITDFEPISFTVYDHPTVSIIIPAYNQFAYTYNCLKAIKANSGDVTYEIIIGDDCSNDLTVDMKQVISGITVIRNPQNLLFLRNCNNAAKKAKGDYILFLNNDTQVQPNWLHPLVDLMERDSSIGITGSKLVYSDGSLQEAGGILWKDGSAWNYGRNQDANNSEYNYVRETDYISGASLMIRTSLWKQLGGFDETFAPAYCEDSDLCFQCRAAGYKVVYQPLSKVVHFEGKSNGTDTSKGIKKYQVENSKKFYEKWKDVLSEHYPNGEHVFRARERSQGKKILLMVDHYIPEYDYDAGSKTVWGYLKMFVEKGFVVKFIGDNFYQSEPYVTTLGQYGIECLYGHDYYLHWKDWLKDNADDFSYVWLNRPHISIKYIDYIRKVMPNAKIFYYGHDLHFLRLSREYEVTGDKKFLTEAEDWKKKELYLMRNSDCAAYPSYVEEEAIKKIDPKINVRAINAYVFEKFASEEAIKAITASSFVNRKNILFVGGFGHPPNEDAVLWFCQSVLPSVVEKIPDLKFIVVGSRVTDKIQALASDHVIIKGYATEEELAELYHTCRMTVIPLRVGAGIKGKVIEAMYYGLPIVTTPIGIEGIVGTEDFIDVTDDADKMSEIIVERYNSDEKLAEESRMSMEYTKKNNNIEAVWDGVKNFFVV